MKTAKIKIIFSLLLTFLISISAFLLLQPSFKVNAAEEELTNTLSVIEVQESNLPGDLRNLESAEDISGKYIFFSQKWINAETDTVDFYTMSDTKYSLTYTTFSCDNVKVCDIEAEKYYALKMPQGTEISNMDVILVPDVSTSMIKVSDTFTVSESDTDNNIGDWFNDLGNTISDWFNENVGLAVSGSAVLVIGGILLLFILFRKRR